MAGTALIEQVVKDLKGFDFKNKPMFRMVEAGSGDVDDAAKQFKNTPHAQVRYDTKDSDDDEPQLGTRDIIVKVFNRDHSGGPDGTKQQLEADTRASYGVITEYLNENYEYKAGGVYERAMSLDNISRNEPEGEGLYSFEVRFTVLIG